MLSNKQREVIRRRGLRPTAERLEGKIVLSTMGTTNPVVVAPATVDVATTTTTAQPVTTATPVTTSTTQATADTATKTSQAAVSVASVATIDKTAPFVTGTTMLTRGDQVVGFVVRFSKPMDTNAVQDLRNYNAYQITQPNKYLARLLYQSDKPKANSLGIHSATYVPASHSVVLLLTGTKKAAGQFRVELSNPTAKGPMRARLGIPDLADETGLALAGPTGPQGHALATPIMLRPGNRLRIDRLAPGSLPA